MLERPPVRSRQYIIEKSSICCTGRSVARSISRNGLIAAAAVTCSAGVCRPAASGMAAIRLKLATVSAVAEIRRALRMETSSGGPAGVPARRELHSRRGPDRLDAGLRLIGICLEILWRFLE